MATTRYTAAQTPREKLIARTNEKPVKVLAQALLLLDKPRLSQEERLVRAIIIDSITERCPAADAAFTAWAESDDDRDEIETIVTAVMAA
jgi:hypothetical protein